jgi:hypothetical protein
MFSKTSLCFYCAAHVTRLPVPSGPPDFRRYLVLLYGVARRKSGRSVSQDVSAGLVGIGRDSGPGDMDMRPPLTQVAGACKTEPSAY